MNRAAKFYKLLAVFLCYEGEEFGAAKVVRLINTKINLYIYPKYSITREIEEESNFILLYKPRLLHQEARHFRLQLRHDSLILIFNMRQMKFEIIMSILFYSSSCNHFT